MFARSVDLSPDLSTMDWWMFKKIWLFNVLVTWWFSHSNSVSVSIPKHLFMIPEQNSNFLSESPIDYEDFSKKAGSTVSLVTPFIMCTKNLKASWVFSRSKYRLNISFKSVMSTRFLSFISSVDLYILLKVSARMFEKGLVLSASPFWMKNLANSSLYERRWKTAEMKPFDVPQTNSRLPSRLLRS